MISADKAIVWTNPETRKVKISEVSQIPQGPGWGDPIGASYSEWRDMKDFDRVRLMLETAVELAMQGFDLGAILREFAQVAEFRALGSESFPMCRALTKAIVGKSLEPNTMTFEELLIAYRPK